MRLRYFICSILSLLFVGMTMFVDSSLALGLDSFDVLYSALLPGGFSDPDRVIKWSQAYFRRVQSKRIFDEKYTGTKLASDGPKKSDMLTASPIVEINDLKNATGTRVQHTLIEPLFPDSESRVRSGRVKGQKRVDSERKASKKFIEVAIGNWFESIAEEDVLAGKQEINMGDLYKKMVESLSDNNAAYMDDALLLSFLMGQPPHLFQNVAVTNGMADGAKVVGDADAGIRDPSEHPNTYAWVPNGGSPKLEKAPSNSVADVHETISKIDSTATPGQKLLNAIALKVRTEKMVGTKFLGDRDEMRTLAHVIVDPITMQMIRDDMDNSNTINSAYEGSKLEHPLVKQGDLVWGPLLIREEEKLLDPLYSVDNNFGADAYDSDGDGGAGGTGNDGIIEVTQTSIRRVATDGVERVYVEHGDRTFAAGTPAGDDASIGADGADTIGRVLVLGANSIAHVPGPVLELIERKEDDYKRIVGLGSEHLFGGKRLDFTDASRNFAYNQSSFQAYVYRGS